MRQVGVSDAGENRSRLDAEIEGELEQLVGFFDVLGIDDACKELPALATAVNIRAGKVMYKAVAETFGLPFGG